MNSISFNIASITMDKANQKAIHPDKDGVYKGLVMQGIGMPSRNGKVYEVESMTAAITNPMSCFYKKLIAGQCYGEAGHPMIYSDAELPRMMQIDMSRVSHVVMKVYTGKTTEKGHTIVYGDILPTGPFKDMLKESLESSVLNTAFSLRSLVEKLGEDNEGNIIQKVQALISYDYVDAPGYAAASKIHSASDESYEIKPGKHNEEFLRQMVSQEVINDAQLEDMLGVDKVKIMHNEYSITGNENLTGTDGRRVSLFHTLFNH